MTRTGYVVIEDHSGLHVCWYENGELAAVCTGWITAPEGALREALKSDERPQSGHSITPFRLAALSLFKAVTRGTAAVIAVREADGSQRTFESQMSALAKDMLGIPNSEPVLLS